MFVVCNKLHVLIAYLSQYTKRLVAAWKGRVIEEFYCMFQSQIQKVRFASIVDTK